MTTTTNTNAAALAELNAARTELRAVTPEFSLEWITNISSAEISALTRVKAAEAAVRALGMNPASLF